MGRGVDVVTGRRRRLVAVLTAAIAVVGACAPDIGSLTPQQQVDQLIAFVESSRGHAFVTRPDVEFVPDAEFQQHVLASIEAAEPALDIDEVAFTALGWMPPADDLFEKYRIAFGGAVVGFYDPVTKVLEVRGDTLTAYRREVVVHELTHALDDQLFDLNESMGDGILDEQQVAFLVGVEGSAVATQQAYSASLSLVEQAQSLAEQLSFPIDPELITVPIALLSISQTPYLQGPRFVGGLGGNAGLDAMFDRYPTTAEQAWDPTKYLANEGAAPVATPPADGAVVDSGSWGRFNMSLVLSNGINLDGQVDPVTDGWAGDAFVTWTDGAASCIRIDTVSDDATRADALRAALTGWASGRAGAQVATVDAVTTRLTSCN